MIGFFVKHPRAAECAAYLYLEQYYSFTRVYGHIWEHCESLGLMADEIPSYGMVRRFLTTTPTLALYAMAHKPGALSGGGQ